MISITLPLSAVADESKDIPTNASETGVHNSLVAALAHAQLVSPLEGDGPFTVFAPTDAAFEAAGIDLSSFDTDEENATLVDILTYHVVVGEVLSSAITTGGVELTAYNGDNLSLRVENDTAYVNQAMITQPDVMASNGVIHVIDTVLLPPEETTQGPPGEICYNVVTHTIAVGADQSECEAYMYVENYTMGDQNITGCYNMVTHQVTNVTQTICDSYMWTPSVHLVMTAAATTIHSTLVQALTTASLDSTLSGNESFTLFAPTDDAFVSAGIDLATTTLTVDELTDVLLFHAIPGKIMSSDIAEGETIIAAANGENLTITKNTSGVYVNGAMVSIADVPASNGVIHVIDAVLLPPADETTTPPAEEEDPCDTTITVSGTKFSPVKIGVDVGDTVCWEWENADMAHNIKEVTADKSTVYVENGIYSGEAATTFFFKHTFTENSTFYYACVPHINVEMFGTVVIGDGGEQEPTSVIKESEDTPGFLAPTFILALLGAAMFARGRNEQ